MSPDTDLAKVAAHVEELKRWMGSYKEELSALRELMLSDAPSLRARYTIAAVLNYQLRKTDITPDWVPELGMVDDAMVMRTGAAVFAINNLEELPHEQLALITRLRAENETIKEMLGADNYDRLFRLIRELIEQPIHDRTPEQILSDEQTLKDFSRELDDHIAQYRPPQIPDAPAFYRRLLSHIDAKLS